jgi:hypothetical protein
VCQSDDIPSLWTESSFGWIEMNEHACSHW